MFTSKLNLGKWQRDAYTIIYKLVKALLFIKAWHAELFLCGKWQKGMLAATKEAVWLN